MHLLDSSSRLKKYDVSGMLKILEAFPDQCAAAKDLGNNFELAKDFKASYKNIVCTGMGGSAIGADLVRSYTAPDSEIPVFVNRSYNLPDFVNEDTLVIASSYSGRTEETLSAYRDAKSRGARIIVITSGGELGKKADEDGISCIRIPSGIPPRAALGYSFLPTLILFSKIGIIKNQSAMIDDAINNLKRLRDDSFGSKIKYTANPAKKTANRIFNKFVVIYGGQDHIDSIVTRWRGQLAENAKTLASSALFPEMNHNEIVGWENPAKKLKDFAVVMLRDAADHPRISKRMDITKNILKGMKIDVIEAASTGRELLARMFSLIYMGDYVSFYLAMLNGVDPTPVERITLLKKELNKV